MPYELTNAQLETRFLMIHVHRWLLGVSPVKQYLNGGNFWLNSKKPPRCMSSKNPPIYKMYHEVISDFSECMRQISHGQKKLIDNPKIEPSRSDPPAKELLYTSFENEKKNFKMHSRNPVTKEQSRLWCNLPGFCLQPTPFLPQRPTLPPREVGGACTPVYSLMDPRGIFFPSVLPNDGRPGCFCCY